MKTTMTRGNFRYSYYAVSATPITEDMAIDAQWDMGKPCPGYGFYAFKTGQTADGQFWACWESSASAD